MKNIIQLFVILICTQLTIVWAADPAVPEKKSSPKIDIRVIIDISGSMKKNDPKNLRVPALKLLVGLLPEGVHTGVWTFGTKVKPLVKHGVVNKKWKKKANKAVKKITSRDMYTNVESALKIVTKDWGEDDSDTKRNIILLTDGMVDVSKNQEVSDQSRQRILDEILPMLQSKGVTVNTISLSENADLELMDALAIGTDGWSEQVNDAEQLQRVFLHMFEKSAPRDTVPLDNNEFTIDKMIEEFTLLVFRNKDIRETTVIPPKGEKFTLKTKPKNIAWLEEDGYDLITITKPTAGVWKIDAELDPDNRVMVVTKLKLQTSKIPNSIFLGEKFDYKFWLTAGDKKIKKEAFYKLINIKMIQNSNGELKEVWDLENRNSQNEFVKELGESLTVGEIELNIVVDGKTFKREHKQTIKVYDQIYDVETRPLVEIDGKNAHVLQIKAKEDLIDLTSFEVLAEVTAPDMSVKTLKGTMSLLENDWLVTIKDPLPGEYNIVLEINAKTKSGRELSLNSPTIIVGEPLQEEEGEDTEMVEEEVVEETDWMRIGIIILIANVVLFGLIGAIWFFLKKRKNKAAEPGDEL